MRLAPKARIQNYVSRMDGEVFFHRAGQGKAKIYRAGRSGLNLQGGAGNLLHMYMCHLIIVKPARGPEGPAR